MDISNIKIRQCDWTEIHDWVASNIKMNNITVDSFWEDHVINSNHYILTCGEEKVGYFAINNGLTIMLFYVIPKYASLSQELFSRVKKYESATNAMVATGDEFFLSHCFDSFQRIEKQAYFSIYTEKEIPKESQLDINLTLANIERDKAILELGGDFLKEEITNIKEGNDSLEIYIVKHKNDVVGFGVVQYGRVVADIASIGMFVCKEHRQKGFGANILQNLKHLVQNKGYKAFSGCWYYNHNSKKTMESAGAFSKTRLIRFYF